MGLTVVAYLFLTLAFGWSVFGSWVWVMPWPESKLPVIVLLFCLISYWVHKSDDTVHVTVAGVVVS
jgi:hypothetical protein